ncbi:MAG: nitrogen regulatory protein [Firmicutes bacterium]|nr:nitrogen regulatory protein [Bacillota bacterium]
MKEVIAVVRMNKTSATKKALVEAGVAGFTAFKVEGRGKIVTNPTLIAERKKELLMMAGDDQTGESEKLITDFLVGTSLFPRRMFIILAHDEDVKKIVDAIIAANKTCNNVGDGKIFVLPVIDAVRVRTGESGETAV